MSKVITGTVRFSYLNWAATKVNDLSGKAEFSTQILVPKKDTETVAKLKAAIKAAMEKKFGAKLPPQWRNPLRDGDTETNEDGSPKSEEYKGHYFLNIKSDQRPGVVGTDLQPLMDANDFVSGDYGRASISAYAYDAKGNKGASFGWNNAQFLRKGESLSGRTRAEDEFAAATAVEDSEF